MIDKDGNIIGLIPIVHEAKDMENFEKTGDRVLIEGTTKNRK